VLEKKLSAIVTEDFTAAGGVQAIVDILNNVDRGTEKYIMETLEVEDTDLAEEIKKECLYSKIYLLWTIAPFKIPA